MEDNIWQIKCEILIEGVYLDSFYILCLFNLLGVHANGKFNLRKTNAANEGWLAD